MSADRISLRAALFSSCLLAAGGGARAAEFDGKLYVTSSTYAGTAATIAVGRALPNSNGAVAVADGSYPGVFGNDAVDGNFGVASPIILNAYAAVGRGDRGIVPIAWVEGANLTAVTGVSTSFSSKSELALHLSTDGGALTLMGYVTQPNTLDVSNANTPDNVDPTNTDTQTPTYRAVVQVNLSPRDQPRITATPVGAYSGNNGRSAILAANVNGSGAGEYLMVGNAGNGSGIEPTDIVNDTGVQTIAPHSASPVTTVIGAQQGTPGSKNGFEYGFAVAQLGYPADKSGKDDNFRGLTVFDNRLYVTKGSGGNGVDSVYEVTTGNNALPTPASGPSTQISILPGFPTALASATPTPATEFFPFGIWFANADTLYVADEGSQDLNADPNAGLQKWVFNGAAWVLAYTIQAGLNLDQPYSVANYPSQDAPATTGLRNLTGAVRGNAVTLFATTATYSGLADPGADPNQVVRVVDRLDATTLPTDEGFTAIGQPYAGNVYRGVEYVAARGPRRR